MEGHALPRSMSRSHSGFAAGGTTTGSPSGLVENTSVNYDYIGNQVCIGLILQLTLADSRPAVVIAVVGRPSGSPAGLAPKQLEGEAVLAVLDNSGFS